jgi:FkbM family methyltransferase
MAVLSATRIRRGIGDAARAAQPHTRSLSAFLLRAPIFRQVLNRLEERLGDLTVYGRRDVSVSDLADFALHSKSIDETFLWTAEFAGRAYVVPVDPAFPHEAPLNDPWGPATYWHRAQNRKLRHVYERLLGSTPQGTFLDVGANWGMHAFPFAAHGFQCVCFEPQSTCCRFIERVRALNRFQSFDVVQGVVGATCQEHVTFYESETEVFSSMDERHVARFNRPFTRRTVRMVTLDAICAEKQLSPAVVKIDTEGFEWDVIRGGIRTLERHRPALVVEVSSSESAQRAMWQALTDLGYRSYWTTRTRSRNRLVTIDSVDAFLEAGTGGRDDEERDFVFVHQLSAYLPPAVSTLKSAI